MKFKVSKHYKMSLSRELVEFEKMGVITGDQRAEMIDAYEVTSAIGLTRIVSVVGAVLVGLGILTYIAGNWAFMSPMIRMIFIVGGMAGAYFGAEALEISYPKSAKALRYISLFIFGGGLFLTDQTFHLNRPVAFHFLIWSAGLLAVLWNHRDQLLMYFFQLLIVASSLSLFDVYNMTDAAFYAYYLVLVAGVFLSVRLLRGDYSTPFSVFLTGLSIVLALLCLMIQLDIEFLYGAVLMLGLGLLFMLKPDILNGYEMMTKQLGLMVMGFAGFTLTFADSWEHVFSAGSDAAAIGFTIAMILGMLYLVKKNYLGGVAFVALIILRYYFDTFYDFMPKSMFFVIGGGILIGFGVYLESLRRKGLNRLD